MISSRLGGYLADPRSPLRVVPGLGIAQILAWGSSYYLLGVLARPISDDTGWSLAWVVAGLSVGLLIAGLAAPRVGRLIHERGGRSVMATSAVLLSIGLAGLAISPNLATFVLMWAILGVAMSAGLYDAAFSTLGRIYGNAARRHITTLTLFGGFASTTCWPLSAYFLSEFGWRGTCIAYALIHLCMTLVIYLFVLPIEQKVHQGQSPMATIASEASPLQLPAGTFALLAATITLSAMISTVISVHLLMILQDRGIVLAAAVALGALVGPSQVGARFIEMLIGKYHHPVWTKAASVGLVALGLFLVLVKAPVLPLALVFYGAGIGLESIARASLPLILFGPSRYAIIMGKLARPSQFAQAAAPTIGAALIGWLGMDQALGVVVALACLNIALVMLLIAVAKRPRLTSA